MPVRRTEAAWRDMGPTIGLRQITRAVSDGTGLTQEEAWVFVAVGASGGSPVRSSPRVDAVMRAVDSLRDAYQSVGRHVSARTSDAMRAREELVTVADADAVEGKPDPRRPEASPGT